MKCKHDLTVEHCSICTPYKKTEFEPYTVSIEDENGEKKKIRKTRKKTTYKTDKETKIEELNRNTYWGYNPNW